MIVPLSAPGEWVHRFEQQRSLLFASISPRGEHVSIEVDFNGELVEKLTTTVPHSWWMWAGNPLFPKGQAVEGDVLIVRALEGDADMRIDFE